MLETTHIDVGTPDRQSKESSGRSPRNLFLLCAAVLFLEMACIRWLNATIQVLAYFNNLILISSFFGLGAGCLLSSRRWDAIRWFGAVFLLLTATVMFLGKHGVHVSYDSDFIFVAEAEYYIESSLMIPFSAILGFLINMGIFVVLGQELGKQFREIGSPLRAYAYDIAGSLTGTVAYALLAWLETPPAVWFAAGLGLVLILLLGRWKAVLLNLALGAIALALIANANSTALWSPYYKIETRPYLTTELENLGFVIKVDNIRIQDALDFTRPNLALASGPIGAFIPYYKLPYSLTRPKKVLLLGAGCGNEAYVAAAMGAEEIHAVEIDPVIARIGLTSHPTTPYRLPNVKLFVEDARAYITRSEEKYDLITVSALDSHKVLPGLSNLRLESFFHTSDAFRQLRRLLKPDGAFCLNLGSARPWVQPRTYWSIADAFGKEPQVLQSNPSPYASSAYLIFNDDRRVSDEQLEAANVSKVEPPPPDPDMLLATDDWPYIYLETKTVPAVCLFVLGLMLLFSVGLVAIIDRDCRRPNFHFYFLGAGFMLLETRSITQMSLLFGMTWHVNLIVITTVLASIFVTNLLVLRKRGIPSSTAYPLLLATLILCYFFPFNALLGLDFLPRLAASAVIVGLPILWASFIFSNSFGQGGNTTVLLGSNLLGVVLGGSLEYLGNMTGLRFLYLVALGLYLAAWYCASSPGRASSAKSSPVTPEATPVPTP